jgi:hypothetical protein
MAHHSNDADDTYIRELFKNAIPLASPFGGTGRFPLGKLSQSDEGEIQFGVAADPVKNKVVLNFGQPTAWIGFDAEQAEQLAESLLTKARLLRDAQRLKSFEEKVRPSGD